MSEIKKATRDSFGQALVEEGKLNENIVVLDADLAESTRTILFKNQFANRFFDCGISECNMIGVGAGLATCGKVVFVASFAMFSVARAFEQIRNTVAYSNLNVKVVGSHSGLSAGKDGATHQCIEDLALMRSVPHMTIVCPADHFETLAAVNRLTKMNGPAYLRLSKFNVGLVNDVSVLQTFKLGKGVVLKNGSDLTLIATGTMVGFVLNVAKALSQQGVSARVINVHTIKPLDEELILKAAAQTKLIVVVEEHNVLGGLGEAVCGVVCENGVFCTVKRIGVNDEFGQSGDELELLKNYGLDEFGIYNKVRAFVKQVLKLEV